MNFDQLANENKDAVYRQMLRACGNHADAEDVVIEALLRAWKNLGQLEQAEAFRGWLAQIARRVCWNLRNREALRPVLQLSELEDGGRQFAGETPHMEEQLQMDRMKALLEKALEAMPETYREVYRMRDLEELSGEEVAQRLGLPLASMKTRLHRARKMLRASIDQALADGKEQLGPERKRANS